jgi:hypothetical protein
MFTRPPFKLQAVPLERLLFPPQCQQRAGLPALGPGFTPAEIAACFATDGGRKVCVADPKVAGELAALLAEGAEFDALEVVCEPGDRKRKTQDRYYVFGGFTRGAAYKLHGKIHSVACNVYAAKPGDEPLNLNDAIFYSLSENHKSVQARGHGSARKSVETLLDCKALLERAKDASKKAGGLAKSIAAACQVSYGLVYHVLRERNQAVDGTKLVTRTTKQSNTDFTNVNIDKGQTPVPISAPPAPTPEAAPTSSAGEDAEPLYTVPADFGQPFTEPAPEQTAEAGPFSQPDSVGADGGIEDVKNRITADRAHLNDIIRVANQLDEMLREARKRIAGPLLERVTVRGEPLLVTRTVRERTKFATVDRGMVCCRVAPAVLVDVLRRVRPKSVCAGCMGAACVACRGLGFVPDDDSLIRGDDQQAFDFGEIWSDEAGDS